MEVLCTIFFIIIWIISIRVSLKVYNKIWGIDLGSAPIFPYYFFFACVMGPLFALYVSSYLQKE